MSSFKLLARPGELLFTHQERVAGAMLRRFRESRYEDSILPVSDWENLVFLTGFSHDFGKATSFFQQYIVAEETAQTRLRQKPETHHGLLSAIFTHWLLQEYLQQIKSENPLAPFLPFLFFLMVKRHHGNLTNPLESELFSSQFDCLPRQLEHLDWDEIQALVDYLNETLTCNFSLETFPREIESYVKAVFKNPIKGIRGTFGRKYPATPENYVRFQFFYSLLLQADKESVAFETTVRKRAEIDPLVVIQYKQANFGVPKTPMDELREIIFQDAQTVASQVDLNQKLFSLNVPTGTGKTLTALSVALTLRDRLANEQNLASRIIYALPFTSIIDQNYDVFQQVLQNPGSDVLLKHHYLSEIAYHRNQSENDDEYDTDQAHFLIETWESEIVVTTFVQLFHTLLTNQNSALKKLHKLANAIILLDEVQTIPIKYWLLVRQIFHALATVLNARVILITATQPRIFEPRHLVELVPEKQSYFQQLDRVNLQFHPAPLELPNFNDFLLQEVCQSGESFLIVLNTVAASIAVFRFLQEHAVEINARLFYLSTNIVPRDRLQRIQEIKAENGKKIIVSTQLIEAGVDLDVENVWRDFGPLDSINQVCGRCNRHGTGKPGQVKIFQLRHEKGRFFYQFIYNDAALALIQTMDIFKHQESFRENEFLQNIDRYYSQIEQKMTDAESAQILEHVCKLNFSQIAEFQLIENEDYFKQDLFVVADLAARAVWERYQAIRDFPKIERKLAFLEFRRAFYEYVISVPRKCIPDKFKDGLYLLDENLLEEFYDPNTGFRQDSKLPEKTGSLIF